MIGNKCSSHTRAVIYAILLGVLVSGQKQRYDGYKLISVVPGSTEQVTKLRSMQQQSEYQLDFWTEPRLLEPTDIMVSPEHYPHVTSLFRGWGLTVRTAHPDIQKLIDQEDENLQKDSKTLSLHHVSDSFSKIDGSSLQTLSPPRPNERFLTYEQMLSYMNELRSSYPGLVQLRDIGMTHENRTLRLMTVMSPVNRGMSPMISAFGRLFSSKPIIFIEAGGHAREWITPAVSLYIVNDLLSNYGNDTSVTSLVDNYDWYILPLMNPDGYAYTHSMNRLWRKNRSVIAHSQCIGTDLNRNFDVDWQGSTSSPNPCSPVYAGTSAFSESESQAIRDVLDSVRTRMHVYFCLHAQAQMILLPWSYTYRRPSDYQELYEVAILGRDALKAVYNETYKVGTPGALLYSAAGSSMDWVKLNASTKWAFAFELRNSPYKFIVPSSDIRPISEETWAAIKAMVSAIGG